MAAITVDDVWRVRGDWRAMREAAHRLAEGRAEEGRMEGRTGGGGPGGDRRPAAHALLRSAAALRHSQDLLGAILDRVDVPMTLDDDGRLTFYPADDADLAALRRAELAAREVQAALETILARHRSALPR